MTLLFSLLGCGLFGPPAVDTTALTRPPDPAIFERKGLVDPIETVSCVLSSGTKTDWAGEGRALDREEGHA